MRSYLMTGAFWAGAAERCVKSVAGVLLAYLGADRADVMTVDWRQACIIALTAGAISILTSIISSPVGPPGSASIVNDRPAPVTDVAV